MVQLLKIFSEVVIKFLPFRTRPLENDFRLNIILPCEGQVVKTLGHELTCEQVKYTWYLLFTHTSPGTV